MQNPALLVLSDTHGNLSSLKAVFTWGKKHHIDKFVFLGDGAEDVSLMLRATAFPGSLVMVKGNCDYAHHLRSADTLDFAGHRFFLTHGHLHRVSDRLHGLIAAAKSVGADAALYGHTHIPFWEEIDGLLVLNPGSAGAPRTMKGASFAVIECPPNEWFKIQYWGIKDGAIRKVIKELNL